MRTLVLAALLPLCLLLSGCLVLSVNPLYTEADIVFEPALLGEWIEIGDGADREHVFRFSRLGERAYALERYSRFESERTLTAAHLVQLGGTLVLDVFPLQPDDQFPLYPAGSLYAHVLYRVDQLEPTLIATCLDQQWLTAYLAEHPEAVAHAAGRTPWESVGHDGPVIRSGEQAYYTPLLLTAGTADLQAFIATLLDEPDAWYDPTEYERYGVE